MIARSAPSPSSPAPSARRYAALGLDPRPSKPSCRECAALTMLHDYLTTSDRSNAGFLSLTRLDCEFSTLVASKHDGTEL
jgi:hypothetical protein